MKKKPERRGKYGYVEFVDKRKLKYDGYDDNIEPEIRKPTPAEMESIILNFNNKKQVQSSNYSVLVLLCRSSNLFSIGKYLFFIYEIEHKNFVPKKEKSLEKSRLFRAISFLSPFDGGLGRVKYAPRTPNIIRVPENILYNKRFLGKRKGRLIGQAVAVATVDEIALP